MEKLLSILFVLFIVSSFGIENSVDLKINNNLKPVVKTEINEFNEVPLIKFDKISDSTSVNQSKGIRVDTLELISGIALVSACYYSLAADSSILKFPLLKINGMAFGIFGLNYIVKSIKF